MELHKGICSVCHNNKVIGAFETKYATEILCSVFSNEALNIVELDNIQSSLRFCPVCYHKILTLKFTSENIKTNKDEDVCSKCVLCKSGEVFFKIQDWSFFDKISEDLVSKDKDACIMCADCLFYLDTRNVMKTKLISKYPQLKIKPPNSNENRRKSRNISDVLSDSTVIPENKRRTAAKDVIVVSSDSDSGSVKGKSINYESLRKLKPLKQNRIFRRREIVKSDSKFLNKIPCVLLKPFNFSNEHINKNALNETDDKGISAKMVHKEKRNRNISKSVSPESKIIHSTPQKKIKPKPIYPKSIKLKREKGKQDIVKDLVVNLTNINLPKHKTKTRNYRHDPEIEKLIDKFNVLQRPTSAGTSTFGEETSSEDRIDLTKETNSVKTKRKSVSFAEEKNVEIEYDSKSISNNDRSKQLTENEKCMNSDDVISESEKDTDDELVGDKIGATNGNARRNNKWKIKWRPIKSSNRKETSQEHEKDGEEKVGKIKLKREKAKPLSKKKGRSSTGDDTNSSSLNMSSENDKETSNSESLAKDETGGSLSSDSEETGQEQEKSEVEREVDKIEVESQPKKDKPKPLSKKKRGNSVKNLEDRSSENISSEIDEETSSPKSLSKDKLDGLESVCLSESSDSSEVEVEREVDKSEVENRPKKQKPKPLSKKKGRNSLEISMENTTEDNANTSSKSTSSEIDKETGSSKSLSETGTMVTVKDNSTDETTGSMVTVKDNSTDEIASIDKDDSVVSNDQKESDKDDLDSKTKVTDTSGDSEDKLAGSDESCTDEETEKDEADKNKESREGESLSDIDIENNTEGDENVGTKEETEGDSKETSLNEDNENECASGTKEDVEDESMKEDESGESKKTSDKSTHLNDSKDIDTTENVNSESENDPGLKDDDKKSDKDSTVDANTEDSSKKIESFDTNSFSGSDKNDELGISEDDTKNINSILTGMFTSEDQSGEDALSEWKVVEKDSDDQANRKRKLSVDELNTSTDKKKKKVTFCEDFT